MKTYLLWFNEGKSCAVMEVTKIVSDAERLAPQLPRALIIPALMNYLNADEIITADTEEQMLDMFENATVVNISKKEDLN
jgi:hypothetical protein